uniref:Variant surface glycoprotein 1480 n=1 Tax=Trypanosoma brucei TaxID=5691 RepID=M4SWH8_9TRYP|nr:variant surface glycoprotein 1480 [Trypanosoma brucei]
MKSPATAVIVSILLMTATPVAHAATEAIKATSLQPYCQYSIQAKGQAQALQSRITSALTDLKGYSKLTKAMKLGALTDSRNAIGFTTLSLYAATKTENARQEIETTATANIVNAAKAAYTAGRVDDFVNVLYTTTATEGTHTANTCLAHTGNDDAVKALIGGCLDDTFTKLTTRGPSLATLLQTNTGTYGSGELSANHGCTLFTAHDTVFSGAAPGTGVVFGGGMFTTHSTPAVNDQTRLKKLASAATIARHKAAVAAVEAASQSSAPSRPPALTEVITLINKAAESGELTEALSKVLNNGTEIPAAKLKGMLETAFGQDFEKDTGRMAAALKQLKAPNGKNKQQTPVLDLEEADLDVAIAHKLQNAAATEKQGTTCTDAVTHSNPEEV